MARECPEKPPMACRRCGEEGHMVKECPKPEICRNCGGEGEPLQSPRLDNVSKLTIAR
jgi:DnaJ-class molecular chaperone